MGYRLSAVECATSKNWRSQTGASGANSNGFAPVRQLRQSLIGRGKVAQLAQTPLRARALSPARIAFLRLRLVGDRAGHSVSGGTRPAGAYGLPTMRSPAHQI